MKKHVKTIVFCSILLLSIISNLFFLSQDAFYGTYYGEKNECKAVYTINNRIVSYELYDEDGILHTEKIGYYKNQGCIKGCRNIEFTEFYNNQDFGLMHRKTIFAMKEATENSWYVCPSAIVLQVIWIIGDLLCIYFGFIRDKFHGKKV